jgi:hypothetical protein
MSTLWNRREFLRQAASCAALVSGLGPGGNRSPAADQEPAKAPDFPLTVIAGKPRERGKRYGQTFKEAIHAFLDREIVRHFQRESREAKLRYAGACATAIKAYSPTILEELEGMAEGTGLRLEEVILITLHEELYHGGTLPAVDHCTVFGAGPPDTTDGATYVAQTWDWMESVYGLSSVLHWKRPEGPSLLAYAYPGLWVGAGLNSAGIALCWHTGAKGGVKDPRVGIPSYVLIAQALYQDSLSGAVEEIKRGKQAGWFSFLLGDGSGNFATVQGNPQAVQITLDEVRTNGGRLRATGGKLDLAAVRAHCLRVKKRRGTLDSMVFDCTKKEAHLARRGGDVGPWKRFRFGE